MTTLPWFLHSRFSVIPVSIRPYSWASKEEPVAVKALRLPSPRSKSARFQRGMGTEWSRTSVGLPMTEVLEGYAARHRLKPGITGWAQVNGCRGEVNSHDKLRRRVALDCYYIDNWSLSLDLWIIVRTMAALLFDADAY